MASSILSGSLAAQVQTSMLKTREDHVMQQMNSLQASKSNAKIDKSAQDFESMLLGTWLQQAESSMGTVPGGDDDEDASGREQMMSLGVQSLSASLAASGGIGIGKMIAKALHATADKQQAAMDSAAGSAASPAARPAIGADLKKIEK